MVIRKRRSTGSSFAWRWLGRASCCDQTQAKKKGSRPVFIFGGAVGRDFAVVGCELTCTEWSRCGVQQIKNYRLIAGSDKVCAGRGSIFSISTYCPRSKSSEERHPLTKTISCASGLLCCCLQPISPPLILRSFTGVVRI